jgi:hypothetical protein
VVTQQRLDPLLVRLTGTPGKLVRTADSRIDSTSAAREQRDRGKPRQAYASRADDLDKFKNRVGRANEMSHMRSKYVAPNN